MCGQSVWLCGVRALSGQKGCSPWFWGKGCWDAIDLTLSGTVNVVAVLGEFLFTCCTVGTNAKQYYVQTNKKYIFCQSEFKTIYSLNIIDGLL